MIRHIKVKPKTKQRYAVAPIVNGVMFLDTFQQ